MNDLNLAIRAAKLASSIIKKYYSEPDATVKGIKDVVTSADIKAENVIRDFLLDRTEYGFIGEETGRKKGNPVWVVDPVDGTRPFCFGIPYFSTSIALVDGKEILLGAVYNPITKELYTSENGKGSFMNGKKLLPKKERPASESLVGGTFFFNRTELQRLERAVNVCLANFSAALDLCRVAEGRIDGMVYGLTKIHDHAAGALIAKEAGVKVTNFGTGAWDPYAFGVIAAKPKLHGFLSRMFPTPQKNLDSREKYACIGI